MTLKIWFLMFPLFALIAGCASMANMVEMDEDYLSMVASKTFSHSQQACYDASKTVIKDMGGEIQKEKAEEFKFVSNRFNIQKSVHASHSKYHSSATEVKSDHKIYISSTGDKNSCTVTFIKYRVWQNNIELDEINESFVVPRVFDPFFNDLKSQLEDTF